MRSISWSTRALVACALGVTLGCGTTPSAGKDAGSSTQDASTADASGSDAVAADTTADSAAGTDAAAADGSDAIDAQAGSDVQAATDVQVGSDGQGATDAGGDSDDAGAADGASTDVAAGSDAVVADDADAAANDASDGAALGSDTASNGGTDASAGCQNDAACDDNNVCTTDTCKDGACSFAANTASCDDGQACTKDDVCASGACKGELYVCDDNEPCTALTCDGVGGCTKSYKQGADCDDGDACTAGDACDSAGNCAGSGQVDCDDGKPCTADSCDSAVGCLSVDVTGTCNDGDPCTELDTCAAGACAGQGYTCPDSTDCLIHSCDGAGGCAVQTPIGTTCTDDNACTLGDACNGSGQCSAGAAATCDDGKPCTADSCDPASGCLALDVTGTCDDGDVCTVGDACASGECVAAGQLDCDDAQLCTTDSCDDGCKNAPNALACDDGQICTLNDVCDGGGCKSGALDACDDGNSCTADSCDATLGCQNLNVTSPCDDGDLCTVDDVCTNGTCTSKPKDCDDNKPCTNDKCLAGSCNNTPDDTLVPPEPACKPDACSVGTTQCAGGEVKCTFAAVDPTSDGKPCGAWGEGLCQQGTCYQPSAPVIVNAWYETGPVLAGSTVKVHVLVEDQNNDAASGINEIASVVYDDTLYGGAELTLTLVPGSVQGKQAEYVGTVTTPVPEEDPNNIRYLKVKAQDTFGRMGTFTLAQLIYKGKLIPVGPTRTLTTIAQGIDVAEAGDVVVIDPGVYTGPGNVNVNGSARQIYVHGPGVTIDCHNDEGGADSFLIMDGPSFDQAQFAITGITVQNCYNAAFRMVSPQKHLVGLTLIDATLRNNQSPDGGGAIYTLGSNTWLTLLHSVVHDNASPYGGGALYATGGAHFRVHDSALYNNHATGTAPDLGRGGAYLGEEAGDGLFERVAVYGNSAQGSGGAFWVRASPINVQDMYFADNTVGSGQFGAAIYGLNCDLFLTRSRFMHHKAGAAVYSDNAIFHTVDGVFEGNVCAGACAGAIASNKGGTIIGTQFRNNQGTPGAVSAGDFDTEVTGATFVGNTSGGDGGALWVATARLNIVDSTFKGNTAQGHGGGLYLSSKIEHIISKCLFDSNSAGLSGGGAYVASGLLSDLRFVNNVAVGDGGGLTVTDQLNWFVSGTSFEANQSGGNGGGLWFNSDGWFTLTGNQFIANHADGDGGGVYGTGTATGNAQFDQLILRDNTAGGSGGGAALAGSSMTYNHLATGNQAAGVGGAFWVRYGNVQLNASTTYGNQAHHGGGIWLSDGKLRLENSIVWGNLLTGVDGTGAELGIDPTELTAEAQVLACDLATDVSDIFDPGQRINAPTGFVLGGATLNLSVDPLFVFGPAGEVWLSHLAAGQAADSPCIDAGNTNVFDFLPWTQGSTRTDKVQDTGKLDLGYRYSL